MTRTVQSDPSRDQVDIAIVGGGIGGLATAVALRDAGFDVHVFERASVLKEVGGPLIIREPSVRLLQQWGLDDFFAHAVELEFVDLLDITGKLIQTSSMDFHGDGAAYAVHRADIHDLLREHVPEHCLHLGQGVVSVRNADDAEHAVIDFAAGSSLSARLVVGADGIHSAVRAAVRHDQAVFQDAVVCRAIAPVSALPAAMGNDRARMWADGARRLLTVPLRGGKMVAVDAIVDASIADDAGVTQELKPENQWNTQISAETVLKRFADFDPCVLRLIEQRIGSIRVDMVYDRAVIDTWARGRIVLVGDAAHPMAPRQGQGANQAIQDAGALADGLAQHGLADPTSALARYHDLRYDIATALQAASRSTPQQLGGRQTA